MTDRDRIIQRIADALMRRAYSNARKCGETPSKAIREAMEAKEFVTRIMGARNAVER